MPFTHVALDECVAQVGLVRSPGRTPEPRARRFPNSEGFLTKRAAALFSTTRRGDFIALAAANAARRLRRSVCTNALTVGDKPDHGGNGDLAPVALTAGFGPRIHRDAFHRISTRQWRQVDITCRTPRG